MTEQLPTTPACAVPQGRGWKAQLARLTATGCQNCGKPGKVARYLIWIGLPVALVTSLASLVLALVQR